MLWVENMTALKFISILLCIPEIKLVGHQSFNCDIFFTQYSRKSCPCTCIQICYRSLKTLILIYIVWKRASTYRCRGKAQCKLKLFVLVSLAVYRHSIRHIAPRQGVTQKRQRMVNNKMCLLNAIPWQRDWGHRIKAKYLV